MKWARPRPMKSPVMISSQETDEENILSSCDPAFADFNLPLLDQQPVRDSSRLLKKQGEIKDLSGWDI